MSPFPVLIRALFGEHCQALSSARQPYIDPGNRQDLSMMTIPCPYCDVFHWIGEKIGNSSMHKLEFTSCCQCGHVDIPYQSEPPGILSMLLECNNDDGKQFRTNIRQYNMALAFTSLWVTEDKIVNQRGGWVFRVQGELCHLIRSLCPDEGHPPSYTQLYFYDASLALAQRMNRNENLAERTMDSLQTMLIDYH